MMTVIVKKKKIIQRLKIRKNKTKIENEFDINNAMHVKWKSVKRQAHLKVQAKT